MRRYKIQLSNGRFKFFWTLKRAARFGDRFEKTNLQYRRGWTER